MATERSTTTRLKDVPALAVYTAVSRADWPPSPAPTPAAQRVSGAPGRSWMGQQIVIGVAMERRATTRLNDAPPAAASCPAPRRLSATGRMAAPRRPHQPGRQCSSGPSRRWWRHGPWQAAAAPSPSAAAPPKDPRCPYESRLKRRHGTVGRVDKGQSSL